MPTPAELVDRYGFPTYARLYAAAEASIRSRTRLRVAEQFSKAALSDIIKSAIGSSVSVGSVATRAISEVRTVGLGATAPLSAGFAGSNIGIGIGVGVLEGEIRSTTPALDSYEQIQEVARQFRSTAFRQLPCLEQPSLRGRYISAWQVLTDSQLAKNSAKAVAKEAAHQIDMLGRAWNQLAEVATPANSDSRGAKPKWRKCRIAAEVAGALAWFKRKYTKSSYFHDKLVEDYCEVGGLFSVMEAYWRENSEKIVLKALMASVRVGIGSSSRTASDREAFHTDRAAVEREALKRIKQGAGAGSTARTGHLSSGTTNYRD
jgi:hypothetical protein